MVTKRERNTLAIAAADGDDMDVLLAVEKSFGVTFARPVSWVTVGDAFEALCERVPTSDAAGETAADMAFTRLRLALRAVLQTDRQIEPGTKMRDLTRRSTKDVLMALSHQMKLPTPGLGSSWIGSAGVLCLLVGVLGSLAAAVWHGLWPVGTSFLFGLVLIRVDPGTFGSQTVGNLAHSFAFQNFSAFAKDGADRRPEAIWAALTSLLGELAEVDPATINRDTRLLA
jgi:hypothetical protein